MSIVILRQDAKIAQWKKAIQDADHTIAVYAGDEEHPKENIIMALVWKHREGSLAEYPNLECIACSGAGVDFILKDATAPAHLPITRVIDPNLAGDMSEHVLAIILSNLKNLRRYQLDQISTNWAPQPYRRIADHTVGILGMGALGLRLAEDLILFGFRVQGWSTTKKAIAGVKTYVKEELATFLATSEILVCLLPLTPATKGILNAELFEMLPKGAFVINVARGGHLVDSDLIQKLDDGHLSGAALDVFHEEPLDKNHPFWGHSKVFMTPHCASVSDTASVVPQIIENYHRLAKNKPLINLVSKKKGY